MKEYSVSQCVSVLFCPSSLSASSPLSESESSIGYVVFVLPILF
jgi:hypothetical protein